MDSQKLVLVAEDDNALNMVHRIMFEQEGVRFNIVESGAQAIAAIEEEQPALLLLDILMPEQDGFSVLRYCKEKGYAFPIVVLTNLSSEKDKQDCMALGAQEMLIKSDITTDSLRALIKKYLQ